MLSSEGRGDFFRGGLFVFFASGAVAGESGFACVASPRRHQRADRRRVACRMALHGGPREGVNGRRTWTMPWVRPMRPLPRSRGVSTTMRLAWVVCAVGAFTACVQALSLASDGHAIENVLHFHRDSVSRMPVRLSGSRVPNRRRRRTCACTTVWEAPSNPVHPPLGFFEILKALFC